MHDPLAVAVCKPGSNTSIISSSLSTVGHVHRNISTLCHFFIRRLGTITCQVTGSRWYSSDLPQGGLEVPCMYTFSGTAKELNKVWKVAAISGTAKQENKIGRRRP